LVVSEERCLHGKKVECALRRRLRPLGCTGRGRELESLGLRMKSNDSYPDARQTLVPNGTEFRGFFDRFLCDRGDGRFFWGGWHRRHTLGSLSLSFVGFSRVRRGVATVPRQCGFIGLFPSSAQPRFHPTRVLARRAVCPTRKQTHSFYGFKMANTFCGDRGRVFGRNTERGRERRAQRRC
jgi:hypothetical protein